MGCLMAPFRNLGCLVVIVALALGYFYRDRLKQEVRQLIDQIQGSVPSTKGRPGVSFLEPDKAIILYGLYGAARS